MVAMIDCQLFGPEQFVKLPWKNGLGSTTELLKESFGKSDFAWRLSIALVSQDGLFSDFDGYDRTLLLLKGGGITLEHGNGSRQKLDTPLAAASFPGKGPTTASLHHGPIEDFNIMTRSDLCSAQIHTGAGSHELAISSEANLVLVYASAEMLAVSLDGAEPVQVPVAHLLRVDIDEVLPVRIVGAGYIAVEIFDAPGVTPGH